MRRLLPRNGGFLALLAVFLLGLVPYRDFFSSHVPIGRDLLFYFYPLKAHLAEGWRAGEIPWVDRYHWGGAPLLGAPGAAPFDPANALFVFLPLGVAMKTWILLRLLCGIAGFAALSRRLGLSAQAAAVAGLAFGLGGVSASLAAFLPTAAGYSLLPWLAAFVLDLKREPGLASVTRVAVVAALLLVSTVPELALYAALVGAVLLLPRSLPSTEERRRLVRAAATAGAAGLLALGLAAPALLPAAATAAHSLRGPGGGVNLTYAGERSLPPARLKELLLDGLVADWTLVSGTKEIAYPYLPSITPGRLALLLSLAGLALGGEGRARALVLAVLGALLALGPATPVWRGAARLVPVLQSVRYPEKYVILTGFALAWLAALGLGALERRLRPEVARLVLPILAVGILIDRAPIARALSPTGPGALLTARPAILGPLPAAAPDGPPPRLFHVDSYSPIPIFGRSDVVSETRAGAHFLMPAYASLFGVAHQFDRDYDLTLPPETQGWAVFLSKALPSGSPVPLRIVRGAGTAAWVKGERHPDGGFAPRLHLFADAAPPYRFARRLVLDSDAGRLFQRILGEGLDAGTAYLPELPGPSPEALSTGLVLQASDRPDGLRLKVSVTGPPDGFLMLYRLHEAAREATLDGRAVPVYPLAFGFALVRVPPGEHELQLRPDTRWVKIGMGMLLISAALLAAAWTSSRRQRPAAA